MKEESDIETLYKILHDLTKFTKFLLHENRRMRNEIRRQEGEE